LLHKPPPLRRLAYVDHIALSNDRCECCGGSIRDGPEPQRIVRMAAAGRRHASLGEWLEPADAGLCSDRCRDLMERPIITAVLQHPVG
jgi:hypothetical protein